MKPCAKCWSRVKEVLEYVPLIRCLYYLNSVHADDAWSMSTLHVGFHSSFSPFGVSAAQAIFVLTNLKRFRTKFVFENRCSCSLQKTKSSICTGFGAWVFIRHMTKFTEKSIRRSHCQRKEFSEEGLLKSGESFLFAKKLIRTSSFWVRNLSSCLSTTALPEFSKQIADPAHRAAHLTCRKLDSCECFFFVVGRHRQRFAVGATRGGTEHAVFGAARLAGSSC